MACNIVPMTCNQVVRGPIVSYRPSVKSVGQTGSSSTVPMLLSMDVMAVRDWTYVEDLPKDIGPARHLLEVYSKIPYQDLDDHIRRVVSTDNLG